MWEKRKKPVGEATEEESDLALTDRDAQYWERAYQTFREEYDRKAGRHPKPGKIERRAHPRLNFPAGSTIYIHDGPKEYPILNISVGGIAFQSSHRYEPGDRIVLSAMGMLALDVEVLECTMEEADADFMEYRYLVRGRFGERVNGYQAFVLAREVYQRLQDNQAKVSSPA